MLNPHHRLYRLSQNHYIRPFYYLFRFHLLEKSLGEVGMCFPENFSSGNYPVLVFLEKLYLPRQGSGQLKFLLTSKSLSTGKHYLFTFHFLGSGYLFLPVLQRTINMPLFLLTLRFLFFEFFYESIFFLKLISGTITFGTK